MLYSIKNNNDINYPTKYKNFYDLTHENIKLSKSQLSKIKNSIIDNYKGLSLNEIIEKVKIEIPDLYIIINDINYQINIKNKVQNRQQRIIFFGIKTKLQLLKPVNTIEFFLDITFKIIPADFHPYKLMVLSGLPNKENKPHIISLILIKYLDNIAYSCIFEYLYENYGFQPKIIQTDFEKAIQIAIKNNKYIKNVIHSRCFFHFSKMIREKLSKKKKLNKFMFEIICNIELLCFINIDKIKAFKKIILYKLKNMMNFKNL